MGIPADPGLRSRQGLDHGIGVVRVAVVVGVVVEDLHVAELVEHDVLDVVAAIRPGGVVLAPAQRPPVEDVAVLAHPHREPGRGVPGLSSGFARLSGRTQTTVQVPLFQTPLTFLLSAAEPVAMALPR